MVIGARSSSIWRAVHRRPALGPGSGPQLCGGAGVSLSHVPRMFAVGPLKPCPSLMAVGRPTWIRRRLRRVIGVEIVGTSVGDPIR